MERIIIRSILLPHHVKGIVNPDENGDYNVYVNARMDIYNQRKTAQHEIQHIIKGHLYDYNPVVQNEIEADAG